MPKRKVFISHSSHNDTALERLETLVELIETAGYEVLCDKRKLNAGQEWHQQISGWMNRCHIAIVLIDGAAVASAHVKHEVSVLGDRLASRRNAGLEPDLILLPCIVEQGLSRSKAASAFSPARLGELHILPAPETGTAAQSAFDALCACGLEPTFSGSPLDRLIEELERRLTELPVTVLEDIATRPELDMPQTFADCEPDRIARCLAEWIVDVAPESTGVNAISRLAGAIVHELHYKQIAASFYELVETAEARWLGDRPHDPFERLTLPELSARPRAIALNGQRLQDYSVRCFAHRAWLRDQSFEVICHEGLLTVSLVTDTLIRFFELRYGRGRRLTPKDIDRKAGGRKLFLCVLSEPSPAGADDPLIAQLSDAYRNITFVGAPGPTMPTRLPDCVWPVMPALNIEEEASRADKLDGLSVDLEDCREL